MHLNNTRQYSIPIQYLLSIALVLLVSGICFVTDNYIGYKTVALLLLVTVSFIAMLFEIAPVLVASVLSALIWNFFFIPPLYTFHINNTEDVLMFSLYFLIALVNAMLTFEIRRAELKARDKEEKEKTIKLYNTLLNSLSHELRTPVSTIIGAVDTLKENNRNLSESNKEDLLNEIQTAGMRLNRQVENLLNMSRLQSGMLKPKLDWCDINEVVYSVLEKLSITKNKSILFTGNDRLPILKLDAGLLEQILFNIIHNAIQYTPEHSTVSIDVSYDSNLCKIIIADNGHGFPIKELDYVFDKFYRLPNTRTGGIGLGLSIAKGFVEAMNGKITLQNRSEGGAVFTIEIPAEPSFINNLKNE